MGGGGVTGSAQGQGCYYGRLRRPGQNCTGLQQRGGGSGWLGGGKRSFFEDFQIICVEEGLLEGCGGIQTIWLGAKTRLGGNNGYGRVSKYIYLN